MHDYRENVIHVLSVCAYFYIDESGLGTVFNNSPVKDLKFHSKEILRSLLKCCEKGGLK
jgi:hypothetical protein